MMPHTDTRKSASASSWYRQPVLWLGAVVFVASMAGCIWLIVAGAHHADTPVGASHTVFDVPARAHSSHDPSP
jgi:hypothetical protein